MESIKYDPANLEDQALMLQFQELFKLSLQNIPTNSIYDSLNIAIYSAAILTYLSNNFQYIKHPGKLPRDVVDLALKES